ncbi:MAG: hypothetical protein Q8P57_03260 [Candidatus Pacearchaeota archaeon]|nr:hypothetical protein [Candidatus Pacearchaeota archaeon]
MLNLDIEKAQTMHKLARKDNWRAKCDRTEHFKRFQNLDKCVKELAKIRWILIHKKGRFTSLSLNTQHKSEIRDFIVSHIPEMQGVVN